MYKRKLKAAVVRFVGRQENYKRKAGKSSAYMFLSNKLYNAYFLEYWQGKRDSLHVKDEDGEVVDFIPFEDFTVESDEDNVLNTYEATVKCITHEYDDELFDLTFGHEYRAIGHDDYGQFLVMDECCDCYFYPSSDFEIISDEHGVLDCQRSMPIYDWENTHVNLV